MFQLDQVMVMMLVVMVYDKGILEEVGIGQVEVKSGRVVVVSKLVEVESGRVGVVNGREVVVSGWVEVVNVLVVEVSE